MVGEQGVAPRKLGARPRRRWLRGIRSFTGWTCTASGRTSTASTPIGPIASPSSTPSTASSESTRAAIVRAADDVGVAEPSAHACSDREESPTALTRPRDSVRLRFREYCVGGYRRADVNHVVERELSL